jgi:hypothetical protein
MTQTFGIPIWERNNLSKKKKHAIVREARSHPVESDCPARPCVDIKEQTVGGTCYMPDKRRSLVELS